MKIFRGLRHPDIATRPVPHDRQLRRRAPWAPTMITLLNGERPSRGVPSSLIMTFEPHRATISPRPSANPNWRSPVSPLRDKLSELARCGVDGGGAALHARSPGQSPQAFIDAVLVMRPGRALMCWWATISALANNAPATTPCWTPPAGPGL